jgi:hypothetical protein
MGCRKVFLSIHLISLCWLGCTGDKNGGNAADNIEPHKPDSVVNAAPMVVKVQVGMTYEEIEKILGRPTSIERGAGSVDYEQVDFNGLDKDIKKVCKDSSLLHNTNRIYSTPHYSKIGQLLYVAWIYESDSMTSDKYLLLPQTRPRTRTDTVIYYRFKGSGVKYSAEEYGRLEDSYKKFMGAVYTTDEPEIKNWIEVTGYTKKDYSIQYYRTILFDASSGRVVEEGYRPASYYELIYR